MTTLAALKAEIADDLSRSDLTTQIAAAITNAITHYQQKRFYFTEGRTATFATVAGQSTYSSADDADIPLFNRVDEMFLVDSSSQTFSLSRYDPLDIEGLLDINASQSQPFAWTYWARTFRLYPVPDAVYTIRPLGSIRIAAPASDGEADNPWMTDAYELIRSRAKLYLFAHILRDSEGAAIMTAAEKDALDKLTRETFDKVRSGSIVATAF